MQRFVVVGALVAGCVVQGGKDVPPVKAAQGSGITVNAETQEVGLDTAKVPQVPSCATGQFVVKSATGWECATIGEGGIDVSKTPLVNTCPVGQVVRKAAEGWDCTPLPDGASVDIDTDTGLVMNGSKLAIDTMKVPMLEACAEGQVVVKAATGWECQEAGPTVAQLNAAVAGLRPGSACGTGEVSKWNGTGWECVAAGGGAVFEEWGPLTLGKRECTVLPARSGVSLVPVSAYGKFITQSDWRAVPMEAYYDPSPESQFPNGVPVSTSNASISATGGTGVENLISSNSQYWSAAVNDAATIDLGARKFIHVFGLNEQCNNQAIRNTRYRIEFSDDSSNWATLEVSCPCGQADCYQRPALLSFRYLRLTTLESKDCNAGTSTSVVRWCSIDLRTKSVAPIKFVSVDPDGSTRICNTASGEPATFRGSLQVVPRWN